jgi:cytochrome c oxidase cbb3-type subunit 3
MGDKVGRIARTWSKVLVGPILDEKAGRVQARCQRRTEPRVIFMVLYRPLAKQALRAAAKPHSKVSSSSLSLVSSSSYFGCRTKTMRALPLLVVFSFGLASVSSAQQAVPAPAPAAPQRGSGKFLFESHCALCHGIDGGGGRGPSLRRRKLVRGADKEALKFLIENGIPPEMPDAWFLSKGEIASVAAYVRTLSNAPPEVLPGDAVRGRAIYARSGCSACHILAGEGSGFGPDLTEVGVRRGSARLRETLENPAKTIPENFLLVETTADSGQTVRGIRLNEDTFSVQLNDQQGRIYSFRKSDLRNLKKLRGETPMPAYGSVFSSAELDDLVKFLAAQRGKP